MDPASQELQIRRAGVPLANIHRDVGVSGSIGTKGAGAGTGSTAAWPAATSARSTLRPKPLMLRSCAPLGLAEQVEVDQPYHFGLGDISPTKEVVVYGRYDLAPLDHAIIVGIVPGNQGVPS